MIQLFISPPFGNYIHLPYTNCIKGSFTLEPRSGLFLQIIKTLRYSFHHQGWINKIGLRNPGIDYALNKYRSQLRSNNFILSIAILKEEEIQTFLQKIPEDANLEINISCPNAEKSMVDNGVSKFINPKRQWCILKVSPNVHHAKLDSYYKLGFRQFHMSNTIPMPNGGLSGRSLIPHNKMNIQYMKEKYDDVVIIGGGGIQEYKDVLLYKQFGADHVSMSSNWFNPYRAFKLYIDFIRYI